MEGGGCIAQTQMYSGGAKFRNIHHSLPAPFQGYSVAVLSPISALETLGMYVELYSCLLNTC